MLVYSWIVLGILCGVAGHLYLGRQCGEHYFFKIRLGLFLVRFPKQTLPGGYDLFGEILVGICGASATGTVAPIVLGVRTGSVDILSDVGLLTAFLGAFLAVACLVWFTPKVAS